MNRFAPFRDGRFRLFFATYTGSLLGTGMASVALSFAVLGSTGSPADLGYVLAARIVPLVLFLLFGGVLGDRLPRRLVMLTADSIRAVSQGSVALLFALGHPPLGAVMALAAVGGLSEALFSPSMEGLVPALAPREHLPEANALIGLAQSGATIAGPALAGVLVALVGAPAVLAIDALSYALSVVGLALLKVPSTALGRRDSLLTQLREGWTEFRSRTWLWAVTVQFALFNLLVWAPYLVLGPASAQARYGGAGAWGAMAAGFGAGAMITGLALLGRRPSRPLSVATAVSFAWAAPSACLVAGLPLPVVVAGAVCAGCASATFNTMWSTTIQRQVPAEALSRVNSYVAFGAYALGPIGLALAGVVAGATSIGAVLAVGVGWQVVASAVVLALPSVRGVRSEDRQSIEP
ncbi:MFS transporter [Kutzneria sp. NPDC052558]|uniref:MFS transporter n=1 Tax=Kutzneria sp. NPDC052558 TaxID=3364121 RepID=UPI0037CCB881